jgi:photosystem II stability/assembly factor-like uncharacterized protein
MRRLNIPVLLFLFAATALPAQVGGTWKRIKDRPQGENNQWRTYLDLTGDERSLIVLSKLNDGVLDTGMTMIERSTNQGKTWSDVTPPGLPRVRAFAELPTLRALAHPSPDVIVAVGDGGMIVRSTDAGESWSREDIQLRDTTVYQRGYVLPFEDVSFHDERHGIIMARLDYVLLTHDGGVTWEVDTLIAGEYGFSNHRGCHMIDSARAVVVDFDNNVWMLTPDKSWEVRSPFTVGVDQWDGAIRFAVAGSELWATGFHSTEQNQGDRANTVVMRSVDKGMSWQPMIDKELAAISFGSRELDFYDSVHGLLMGLGESSLHTANSGQTWNGLRIPFSEAPYMTTTGVAMLSPTEAVAVGVNGVMVHWESASSSVSFNGLTTTGLPMAWLRPIVPLPLNGEQVQLSILLQPGCAEHELRLKVIDARGTIVTDWSMIAQQKARSGSERSFVVNTSILPSGTYWVALTGCNWEMVQPLVVAR